MAEPVGVYVTWQRDPCRTLTVQWLSGPNASAAGDAGALPTGADASASGGTSDKDAGVDWSKHVPERLGAVERVPTVRYRASGQTQGEWLLARGFRREFPGDASLRVHWVELAGLQPGTEYEFIVEPWTTVHKAATLRENGPIRFVAGGCVYKSPVLLPRVNGFASALSPEFALLVGDIAYADEDNGDASKWLSFIRIWCETMVTPEGRVVPMVVTIGNHEVRNGGYSQPQSDAANFYALFALPDPAGYGVLDIGTFASFILLDSGHTNDVQGPQSAWLERTLRDRAKRNVTHVIAGYHIPAYPGSRRLNSEYSSDVRSAWVPLFDEYGLDLAFEAHDHAYKRTQPIRHNRIDPMGTVYLGDGGWAVGRTRPVGEPGKGGWWSNRRWYLARAESLNSFFFVELSEDRRHVEAIDHDGEVFDRLLQVEGQPTAVTFTPTSSRWARVESWVLGGVSMLVLGASGWWVLGAVRGDRARV